jgi:hypothetical protein
MEKIEIWDEIICIEDRSSDLFSWEIYEVSKIVWDILELKWMDWLYGKSRFKIFLSVREKLWNLLAKSTVH